MAIKRWTKVLARLWPPNPMKMKYQNSKGLRDTQQNELVEMFLF